MTRPYLLDSVQLLRGSVDDDGDARYSHLSQNVPDGYVGDLQSDLMALGFEEVGTPDGAFGANTRAAVKAFEELADVPQNGIVERSTKNAMQTWLDHGYTKASRPGAAPVAVPAGTSHIIGPRVVHYSQGDPRWGSRTLGMTSPIQKKGCAICCVAMTLSFYGLAATPLTLDELR